MDRKTSSDQEAILDEASLMTINRNDSQQK